MLYQIIKIFARAGLLVFFRKRVVQAQALREAKGPLILASNHPNSMLDAVIIGIYCAGPVHFTIRSDMFNRPLFRWLLKHMNGIPVYRLTEEKEKMRRNTETISYCKQLLQNNGILLIFAEGATELDWKLKPLKSGLSRIIWHCVQDDYLRKHLQVLPVGLTYSNYVHLRKTLYLQCGPMLFPGAMNVWVSDGAWKLRFNEVLFAAMLPLAPQMESSAESRRMAWMYTLSNAWQVTAISPQRLQQAADRIKKAEQADLAFARPLTRPGILALNRTNRRKARTLLALLLVPGITGLFLNAPFYYPLRRWSRSKTRGSIFYDSLRFSLLVFLYPLYVLLASLGLHWITPWPVWYWLLLFPASAYCAAEAGTAFMALRNNRRLGRPALRQLQNLAASI